MDEHKDINSKTKNDEGCNKPMTNLNIVNIKYVDKTSFWEALGVFGSSFGYFLDDFGDLLGTSGVSLGVSWGPLGGSVSVLGTYLGRSAQRRPLKFPERAAQVLPKGGQGSPRGPQMATKSEPRDH